MTPEKDPQLQHAVKIGHELRDARTGRVFIAGLVLAGFIVLSLVLMDGLLTYVAGQNRETDPVPSPLASSRQGPSGPLLQDNPYGDLDTFRHREGTLLNSYAAETVRGQATGRVYIPVSRAMDLILERGLLNRPTTVPAGVSGGATAR